MSKSRKNPGRKENLQKYKNKHKKQESMNQSQFELPEVRQSPVWKSDELLEVSGQEWETLFNFVENSSAAFMAANAVMSRNIINGKIKLKFEKLNKETLQYSDMSAEEEAPYQTEFQKAVQQAVQQANATPETKSKLVTLDQTEETETLEPPSQEGLPRIDSLVDAQGNPLG